MKAVMYHYVRPDPIDMPYFRHLNLEDFQAQLDYFEKHDRLIRRDEFLDIMAGALVPEDGVLLTFDDGFSDHAEYVLPELEKRGSAGFFYVTGEPYQSDFSVLLNVHRIHCLLHAEHGTAKG